MGRVSVRRFLRSSKPSCPESLQNHARPQKIEMKKCVNVIVRAKKAEKSPPTSLCRFASGVCAAGKRGRKSLGQAIFPFSVFYEDSKSKGERGMGLAV